MTKKNLRYFDILEAKKAYSENRNVTELLRSQKKVNLNTSEIIETAYDLQAGTYINHVKKNPIQAKLYSMELAEILDKHVKSTHTLLDIGTGELTTLSSVITQLSRKPNAIYAFDISWSRIFKGMAYAKKNMASTYNLLKLFVGDINEISLLNKSVNITTSSHALEPNGKRLKDLMNELFRVTIDKLILFEPCFEINSKEGKRRMNKLGYIKNIDGVVKELGGKMREKIILKNSINPLNPTVCFIITPPSIGVNSLKMRKDKSNLFSVPGTNIPLKKITNFYFSNETGLCFPILKDIPIFKSNSSILASALSKQT